MKENLDDTELNKKKEKIILSTKKLIINNGIEFLNMHRIAKASSVGQATLYRRYESINKICEDIIVVESRELINTIDNYLIMNKSQPAMDNLFDIVSYYVAFIFEKGKWICEVNRQASVNGPLSSPLNRYIRDVVYEILEIAIKNNEIKTSNTTFFVESLIILLHSVDYQIYYKNITMDQFLNGLKELFSNN